MAAATALSNACDSANITEGLDPIKMLSQEVANRWQVMTTAVEQKKNVIDSVQRQLKQYDDTLEKIEHLLNRAEATLVSQSATGTDVNKAKVNRDTLTVSGCALCPMGEGRVRVAGVYMHKSALYVRLTVLIRIIFRTPAIVRCTAFSHSVISLPVLFFLDTEVSC